MNACGCDVLCVDVLVQKFKYRLIIVYRPPSSCFGDKSDLLVKTSLLTVLTRLTHPTATTLLLCDFNLPGINWSSLDMPIDGVHDSIYNCLTGLGYFQFVNDVTRLSITGNSIWFFALMILLLMLTALLHHLELQIILSYTFIYTLRSTKLTSVWLVICWLLGH